MELVNIGGQAVCLGLPLQIIPTSVGSLLIDAANERAAGIFEVPNTGNISTIFVRTGTVTTAKSLAVGVYLVDGTTGNPVLPESAYGGMVAGTIATPASNTNYLVSLGTVAAATRGDIVAIIVTWSNQLDPGNLIIARSAATFQGVTAQFGAYSDLYTTSWAKAECMNFAVGYDDGVFYPIPGVFPQPSVDSTLFNSGSTPDERGNKFLLPFPCRMTGYWARYRGLLPPAGPTINLYDASDNVLASHTPDPEIEGALSGIWFWEFPTGVTLAKDTWYRLVFTPAGTDINIFDWQYPSAAMLGALPMGTNCHQTQRTDGGTWTDNTDRRVLMGLLIDQLYDGVVDITPGYRHPLRVSNLSGGLRLANSSGALRLQGGA